VGTGSISASASGSANGQRGLFLGAVAVHVDGFEDAFGQVFFLRRGQLRD
jgi:hypothetical protein